MEDYYFCFQIKELLARVQVCILAEDLHTFQGFIQRWDMGLESPRPSLKS